MSAWGNFKARAGKNNIQVEKIPGAGSIGRLLNGYAKMVFRVTNTLLNWLWALISPAVLSIPGLIVIGIVVALLMLDFFLKQMIKSLWIFGELLAHGGYIMRIAAGYVKIIAIMFKVELDSMGYVVRGTINAIMSLVKIVETGVTYGITEMMQGGVSIIAGNTELLAQAGTVKERVEKEKAAKGESGDEESKSEEEKEKEEKEKEKEKKEVVIKATEDYEINVHRSEVLKKYDITAEMLQYSLRYGKDWNKALAVGEVKRELLENYYKTKTGELADSMSNKMVTSMNSAKEKEGQIKDIYYYTYKTQLDLIKDREERIEDLKYTTEEDLKKERNSLEEDIEENKNKQNECMEGMKDILDKYDPERDKEENKKIQEEYGEDPSDKDDSALEQNEEPSIEEKIEKVIQWQIEDIEKKYNNEKVELEGFTDDKSKKLIHTVGLEMKDEETNEKKKYYDAVKKYNEFLTQIKTERSKAETVKEENGEGGDKGSTSKKKEEEELENVNLSKINSIVFLNNEIEKYKKNIDIRKKNEELLGKDKLEEFEIAFYEDKSLKDTKEEESSDTSTSDTSTSDASTSDASTSDTSTSGTSVSAASVSDASTSGTSTSGTSDANTSGDGTSDDTGTSEGETSKTIKIDYVQLRDEESKTADAILEGIKKLQDEIDKKNKLREDNIAKAKELKKLIAKEKEMKEKIVEIDRKIDNIGYTNEEVKLAYADLQMEKERLCDLYMGGDLYYSLMYDGDNSNESKVDYVMDMYYIGETFEDLRDSIMELLDLKMSTIEDTFGRFIGTENGFEDMSINDALESMIQNRYGGYGYPKEYYTTKNNGDDTLGARVLTFEHTMITAPEDLKLMKTSMEPSPDDPQNILPCISFISNDYLREYRVMGLEDIARFFNAKVKVGYNSSNLEEGDVFCDIVIDSAGNIVTKDYEVYNIVIPKGTAIGSFGNKVVTLAERKAAAERENARNNVVNKEITTTKTTTTDKGETTVEEETITTDTQAVVVGSLTEVAESPEDNANLDEHTSEEDIAIINNPNTYAQVFIEINESSRNSVLDVEPDFIIPIANKGSYRYAVTSKETENGGIAKLYGGVLTIDDPGTIEEIGFDGNGEEYIKLDNGRRYTRGEDSIIAFGDRQRDLLYVMDPYWMSKQYTFELSNDPDILEGELIGERNINEETKEDVIAASGYRMAGGVIKNGELFSYKLYDVNSKQVITYGINSKSEQSTDEICKLDSKIKKSLDYKLKSGEVIGYVVEPKVNGKTLERKEVEVKIGGNANNYDYYDILGVTRDENGLLKVELRNNRTNTREKYSGLSGLSEKVLKKLNEVYKKDSEEYQYNYEDWYKTGYNVSKANIPESKKKELDRLKKVTNGEGIAFTGRKIKRDTDGTLHFEENVGLDVIAPENCILTKAGWSENTGWVIQLTSLDYERRYEFSELNEFSSWIKGVIGSKVGPDWQTKEYKDVTIDEYRIIKKGEMIGKMGASKGPTIGDVPLIAPETLRIVKMGYKIDEKDTKQKYYCIKLESIDGTRSYEITDMDIYNLIIHTGLNGDTSNTNRTMTINTETYKDISYDHCFPAKDVSKIESGRVYYTDIEAQEQRIGEMYIYEGETIGYAKMKPIEDETQKLVGVSSLELKTNIKVGNFEAPKFTGTKKPSYYKALMVKRKAREFDLFDALHVGVQIYKFDKLQINAGNLEEKLIIIDEVEQGKRDGVDVFNVSYTENGHRAIGAVCYDSEGNTVVENQFNYETGYREIKNISYKTTKIKDNKKQIEEFTSNNVRIERQTDRNTKVTTVSKLPIYVPKNDNYADDAIKRVTKIRLYDSIGMSQDYDINQILSIGTDNENKKRAKIEARIAYDMSIHRIECYNVNGDCIGDTFSKEEDKADWYNVDLYNEDKVKQVIMYATTGETLYYAPEIKSVKKVDENSIEIEWIRGVNELKEIVYLNDVGVEIDKVSMEKVNYEQLVDEGVIVETAKITSSLENANDVKNIMFKFGKDEYYMYQCMGIDDVSIDKNGSMTVKFRVGRHDEISEVEVLDKNNEVLLKNEVTGDNVISVLVGKSKISEVGTVILRTKNGDSDRYTISNKLRKVDILSGNKIKVKYSVGENEGDVRIELLDKEFKVIDTATIKDSIINTQEIKITNEEYTAEDVFVVRLMNGDSIEDVYTILGVSDVKNKDGYCDIKIKQQRGIELNRFEFYDKYGSVTHVQYIDEKDKSKYEYYAVSSGGAIEKFGGATSSIKLEASDVGVVIYDRNNTAYELLLKPIITESGISGGKIYAKFYGGYSGVTNMKVYGKGNSKREAEYITFTSKGKENIYTAGVNYISMKEVNINVKEDNVNKIELMTMGIAKGFVEDDVEKIVVTNGIGLSDENISLGIKSVKVVGDKILVEGTGITSCKYVTIKGKEGYANKESNGYSVPIGEVTKIILTQKTYDGKNTKQKVIEGPSIIEAKKVNVEDVNSFAVKVKLTGGTNVPRTGNAYKSNIEYFDEKGNEIVDLRDNRLMGQDAIEVSTGARLNAKNVYKVRVYNSIGLVAEKVVDNKTIDDAELKITDIKVKEEANKTTAVVTVKLSELLEIIQNESGIMYENAGTKDYGDEAIKIEDGSNNQEKKILIDVDKTKKCIAIKVTAKYSEDSRIKKEVEENLVGVKKIAKSGDNINITLENIDLIGIKEIEYWDNDNKQCKANWDKKGDVVTIKDKAEIKRVDIKLNNDTLIYCIGPFVNASKNEIKDKIMLKMEIFYLSNYKEKDLIDKIELLDEDGKLLDTKKNIGEQEVIEIELTGKVKEVSKIKYITKGGFVVIMPVTDKTSDGQKIKIKSIEVAEGGKYKINTKGQKAIKEVFVKDSVNMTERKVELIDSQYIDSKNVVSVKVVDSKSSSDWYDVVEIGSVTKVSNGVKVVVNRNLCNIEEINWINGDSADGAKLKDNLNADNSDLKITKGTDSIEYLIKGTKIKQIEMYFSNGEKRKVYKS